MTDRDRIDAMIQSAVSDCYPYWSIMITDYLIAGGVVVREKGEWLFEETYPGVVSLNGYTCSECGKNTTKKTNFCPNCGTDMREEHT